MFEKYSVKFPHLAHFFIFQTNSLPSSGLRFFRLQNMSIEKHMGAFRHFVCKESPKCEKFHQTNWEIEKGNLIQAKKAPR